MRPSEHRLGVLFEISIVCHVFVFVVLAGGWGFSLFGGCSGLSAVFSRVRGSSGFSLLLAYLRFGRGWWGVGLLGGFLGFGVGRARFFSFFLLGVGWVRLARPAPAFLCGGWVRVRLVPDFPVFWGVGVGCVCASGSFLGCGFRGWVGRPGSFLGVGCAWFPVSCSRWFLVVFAEGVPGVFVSARRFLPLVWGVSGWVGVVFSPAVLPGPGSGWFLVGGWPGFGFGCWFCLESLILAQDERWRRA